MLELYERPPIWREVVAKFRIDPDAVFYAWGNTIYNPGRLKLTPSLIAHEGVHGLRQLGMGVEAWWRRYLDDDGFRLNEEIPAHRAEWFRFERDSKMPGVPNPRTQRRWELKQIAKRLSGPMYGGMVTYAEAKRLITADEAEIVAVPGAVSQPA